MKINDAFWHKPTRALVGSMCLNGGALAQKNTSADAVTTVAIKYVLASDGGAIQTLGTQPTLSLSGLNTASPWNPSVKRDGSPNSPYSMQFAAGVSMPAGTEAYVVFTVGDTSETNTTQVVRAYIGEVVTSGSKRPDLDLTSEAAFGEVKIVNATNAFVIGTTVLSATGVTDTYADTVRVRNN